MTAAHRLMLTTVNISAPDPGVLARFYQRLLGWEIRAEEPHWVVLKNPDAGATLSFSDGVPVRTAGVAGNSP